MIHLCASLGVKWPDQYDEAINLRKAESSQSRGSDGEQNGIRQHNNFKFEFQRRERLDCDGSNTNDGYSQNTAANTHTLSRKMIATNAVLPQPCFTALENLMIVKTNSRDSNRMDAMLNLTDIKF